MSLHVPGFDGDLPFRAGTGYVTVNEEDWCGVYYFSLWSRKGTPVRIPSSSGSGRPGCLHSIVALAIRQWSALFSLCSLN
ncbi:hypothetical protein AXF42_Ash004217 [Apostasia shenzhenica]|uniref:Uncharacterized protein n=1 Tax=Apostasia shenzhenica TaxID=1088818 RepID=A0A2I0A2B2_9ASPA|nr:hypothetical protein AXF42_Ash004217 [Apostasia shenzhenica]